MSTTLTLYPDHAPESGTRLDDRDRIRDELQRRGIGFEQWEASRPLPNDADPDAILAAYHGDIERLKTERGFATADVIRITPEHPQKDMLRAKFLDEHTHSEDEVRFFVEGSGLFVLHIDNEVCALHAHAGDLVSVPAGTRHWFDMGPAPSFAAIRLFTNTEGWVAQFTGDSIASRFPRLDPA